MKQVVLILFCTLFFACSSKQSEVIPPEVLPREKMVQVLLDVHLLEASMNMGASPGVVISSPAEVQMSADVLKKHNISKAQYDQSMSYYSLRPTELSEIYQLVLNELSKMQAEVSSSK